ncbi:MAG: cyclopropane-fatty-acyl-phospholipid synthase family protein [Candidatus Bathyarchaeia archaeon]
MNEQKQCSCPPGECDTFQFMNRNLGMKVLHPGGLQATKLLAEKCGITSDMTVLDAGCGRGSSSVFLAKHFGCKVVGVDVDPVSLFKAQENARRKKVSDKVAFRLADLDSLPSIGNMFDGAVFQASLIFCDKAAVLRSVARQIQPGGFLGAVELAWKLPPTPYIVSRVKSVLCAAAVNAELHSGWVSLFQQANLVVDASEVGHLGFGFRDMVANEGLISASRIALKCSFNKAARRRIAAITNLFKETQPYLGYGIYVCRKSALD